MNFASWIVLIIVAAWAIYAVRAAFFGASKRRGASHESPDDDEKYRLPSACANCSKGSCAGCPSSAGRNVPTPTIHEQR